MLDPVNISGKVYDHLAQSNQNRMNDDAGALRIAYRMN
jgi:hypothetical protein